jgi:hypothetical protein
LLERGPGRAIAFSVVIAAAALAGEGTAAADMFRYVDRDGVVHQVEVAGGSPAASGPAGVEVGAGEEYPFAAAVQEAARLYSLPVELILAVMTVESAFDARAVSPRGAMGLMQLMPPTAADMKIDDAFDPRQNILGGARFLRILLNDSAGDVVVALGSYNAGSGATQRYGGVPPFRDTHQYVVSVVHFYRMYQARGPAFAAEVAASIRAGRKSAAYRPGSASAGVASRPGSASAGVASRPGSASAGVASRLGSASAGAASAGAFSADAAALAPVQRRVASPNKAVVHGEGARARSARRRRGDG